MKNGLVIANDGARSWHQNDRLHRTGGPALEFVDGTRYWYQNGQLHRTDGPAVEWASGGRCWFLNDLEYSFEEYVNKIYLDGTKEKTFFILKWSS